MEFTFLFAQQLQGMLSHASPYGRPGFDVPCESFTQLTVIPFKVSHAWIPTGRLAGLILVNYSTVMLTTHMIIFR